MIQVQYMNPKNGFSWTVFETLRRIPQATMGIFVSSYCPVGCGHCAVSASSRFAETSPEMLIGFVEEMVQVPDLKAVAITGGEPFAEIELLKTLSTIVHSAEKWLVIHSSGYWGKADIQNMVEPVLRLADGLVFGIDLYHRAHIPDEDLINALRSAHEYGVWITAQVICGMDGNAHLAYAHSILKGAYGAEWESCATIVESRPLPSGRAENIRAFNQFRNTSGAYCNSINGPTLLRDGTLAACCNEDVVLHKGPTHFRIQYQGSLLNSLAALDRRPILEYIRKFPPVDLLSLASACLDSHEYDRSVRVCQACWDFVDLYNRMNEAQRERLEKMANAWLEIQKSPSDRRHNNFRSDGIDAVRRELKQVSNV